MSGSPSLFSHNLDALGQLALNTDERDQMTRFLQRLVQTPSPSGWEQDAALLIKEHLNELGFERVTTDHVGNVILRLGDGVGPTVLFDTHMDTVQPADDGWPFAPYEAAIRNGILYGLGACDSKASLAAMIYAARRLAESRTPLHGNLVIAFLVQQERYDGAALRILVEEEGIRPDWVILGEPSDLQIMRGHRGRMLFKVTTYGKSSHAASPDLGQNAITAAARMIFGIDLLSVDLPSDPFLGPGTVAVTHIESQEPSLNAIPSSCTFYVDRRLTLGETAARAHAQLESIIEREGIVADVEVNEYTVTAYTGYEYQIREAFNAWVIDESHPLIQTTSAVTQAVRKTMPSIGRWLFSSDGVYSMGEANIPTVGLGPGDPALAHTSQDQVVLDDVAEAAQVYALLAAALLGQP
jgi:putative selenium metabolism hydrolase